jgi:excisionase family DNA binding protein
MENKMSKIVENYYQKLKEEFDQKPIQMNKLELISLIREIVKEQIEKILDKPQLVCEPEFLSVQEAAKFVNLAVTTLYEKTSLKIIPFHKRDKKLYFKKQELTEWLLGKSNNNEAQILKLPMPKKNKKVA